jgi:two-component system nitrogen regulation response regulator GlnG
MPHRVGERLVLDAVAAGREVALSRNAPDFVPAGQSVGTALDDPFVSRTPIRFAPGRSGGVRLIVGAGTPVVAGSRVVADLEITAEELSLGTTIELADRVVLVLHRFEPAPASTADLLGMVGDSLAIRRVRSAIHSVVDLPVPVLIRGETGTGKELVARAIHERSPQRSGPFVSVNLGALPRDLATSELFGAVRGAYTGAARDRDGLFRTAHGGTLFLDEVGEASPEVQAMLLRVLETGELYPLGADRPVIVQVRLVAATDADLEDRIRAGQFKTPLLHRLAGYEIRVPALRERRDDIGSLFFHFAREELAALGESHRLSPADPYAEPWLPARLASRLVRHPWPGNLRQLKNVTRRLVIESRGLPQLRIDPRLAAELDASDPAAVDGAVGNRPSIDLASEPRRKPSEITEAELLEALRACGWDLKATADRLQIERPSLYRLIERHPGIRTARDLGADEIVRCFRDCDGDVDAMVARLKVSKRALVRRIRELGLTGRDGGSL